MRKTLALLVGMISLAAAETAAAETLKVAVAQRGFWNSTFVDVALKQGYFKEVGLDIEILYTEGGASTLTPVIAGSIDIAMTNGTLGVIAAYAKGMPVKIISAEATGAPDAFWYARPESGIKSHRRHQRQDGGVLLARLVDQSHPAAAGQPGEGDARSWSPPAARPAR